MLRHRFCSAREGFFLLAVAVVLLVQRLFVQVAAISTGSGISSSCPVSIRVKSKMSLTIVIKCRPLLWINLA